MQATCHAQSAAPAAVAQRAPPLTARRAAAGRPVRGAAHSGVSRAASLTPRGAVRCSASAAPPVAAGNKLTAAFAAAVARKQCAPPALRAPSLHVGCKRARAA
jgi:hypothetical protein